MYIVSYYQTWHFFKPICSNLNQFMVASMAMSSRRGEGWNFIQGKTIHVFNEKSVISCGRAGSDYIIESTGIFTTNLKKEKDVFLYRFFLMPMLKLTSQQQIRHMSNDLDHRLSLGNYIYICLSCFIQVLNPELIIEHYQYSFLLQLLSMHRRHATFVVDKLQNLTVKIT